MGQYWKAVNITKREVLNPHMLGCGLKLLEQLATHPGTGAALLVLCAAMPEPRGGGDLELADDVARRTIGRWAGDRIALIGDYAEPEDIADIDCKAVYSELSSYTDITADVCSVIERELQGRYVGNGWRDWIESGAEK